MNQAEARTAIRDAHAALWWGVISMASSIEAAAAADRDAFTDPEVGLATSLILARTIRTAEMIPSAGSWLRARRRDTSYGAYGARSRLRWTREQLDEVLRVGASCPKAAEITGLHQAVALAGVDNPIESAARLAGIIDGLGELITPEYEAERSADDEMWGAPRP